MFGRVLIKEKDLKKIWQDLEESRKNANEAYVGWDKVLNLKLDLQRKLRIEEDAKNRKERTIARKNTEINNLKACLKESCEKIASLIIDLKQSEHFFKASVEIGTKNERDLKDRIHRLQMKVRHRDKKIERLLSAGELARLTELNMKNYNRASAYSKEIYILKRKLESAKKCIARTAQAV